MIQTEYVQDPLHGDNATAAFLLTKKANMVIPQDAGSIVHSPWNRDDVLEIQFYSGTRRSEGKNKKLEKIFLKLGRGPAQALRGRVTDRKVLVSTGILRSALFSPLLNFSQFA